MEWRSSCSVGHDLDEEVPCGAETKPRINVEVYSVQRGVVEVWSASVDPLDEHPVGELVVSDGDAHLRQRQPDIMLVGVWLSVLVGLEGFPFHLRSEEHTSELQSLMRISYAVFCLKKKTLHKSNT